MKKSVSKPKPYLESFASFFEHPTRENFRALLRDNVGELRALDFKAEWPEKPLARHVLGMANLGGGCIVVGVKESTDKTLEPIGLNALKDKAEISNSLRGFLPTSLFSGIDVVDFSYEASEYPKIVGRRFQVLFVTGAAENFPYVALRDGADIRASAIYVRREGITCEASHDELQSIINARLATGYSSDRETTLKQHLEQLKLLFAEIPRTTARLSISLAFFELFEQAVVRSTNPDYPEEDYGRFIRRLIDIKKTQVLRLMSADEFVQASCPELRRSTTKAADNSESR